MNTRLQFLTDKKIDLRLSGYGLMRVGETRKIAEQTLMYLHIDNIDGVYTPAVTVFCNGRKVKPVEGFCYDLLKQVGLYLCIRSMRFDGYGRPVGFRVETYRQPVALLRVV